MIGVTGGGVLDAPGSVEPPFLGGEERGKAAPPPAAPPNGGGDVDEMAALARETNGGVVLGVGVTGSERASRGVRFSTAAGSGGPGEVILALSLAHSLNVYLLSLTLSP